MKTFKLKYFVAVIVIATQWSCAVDEGVKEAENATAATSDFVIEPEMNYIIDGALTYDYDAVKVAAKDAWNIHFDGTKNSVVISTTPETFEVYKKSNKELREQLASADYEAAKGEYKILESTSQKYIPAENPSSVKSGFEDKTVIGFTYTGSGGIQVLAKFVPTSDADLSALYTFRIVHNGNGTVNLDWAYINIPFYNVFNSASTSTNQRIMLNNESTTSSITKTFYNNTNYGGTSLSFTCAANGNLSLSTLKAFGPKSYK